MKPSIRQKRSFKLLSHACRLILACTFILSGFTKVIDPWGTALKVNEYLSIYGMEALEPASMTFSIWLCGAELMMGCMLLFKVRIRLISIFALASMIFFTLLTLLSATLLPVEDCGCFGEALKLTPWETFFKNLVLLPMAFVVWWRYRPDRIFAFKPLEIALTCVFFSLSMYLGYYCYIHLPLIDFLPYKVGVNIREAMQAPSVAPGESETVLIYRNLKTGEEREFSLDDPEWQDADTWEWVDTRTTSDVPAIRPLISEFALRDAEGDATGEVLSTPGRLYMLCVTSFDRLSPRCARRMARLVEHAAAEGARVVCLTPDPLYDVCWHDFGSGEVRCYNIDASTMKTMLPGRATEWSYSTTGRSPTSATAATSVPDPCSGRSYTSTWTPSMRRSSSATTPPIGGVPWPWVTTARGVSSRRPATKPAPTVYIRPSPRYWPGGCVPG